MGLAARFMNLMAVGDGPIPGDHVMVETARNHQLRGKTGTVVRFTGAIVSIDGEEHPFSLNSLRRTIVE